MLWFAWKYLPLWYQQQRLSKGGVVLNSCDLLENIYLCGINNNQHVVYLTQILVVICLKISTFVVSTTTCGLCDYSAGQLWFAWKYLPLWYQQQLCFIPRNGRPCCDLLENIYLCGINNNFNIPAKLAPPVVICLKISTFVVSTTTECVCGRYWNPLWFACKYIP